MKNNMEKILIIVPAFNEEASLKPLVADIRTRLPEGHIVIVNDGSSDNTREVAEGLGVTVLSHPFNMGIGATMQTGFKYALRNCYDVAVQVDGDGQHRPDQLGKLIEPLNSGADIVVGSRFLGEGDYTPSVARMAGIKIFSKLVSLIIGEKVTDTTSGFRASGRRTIEFFAGHYPDDYPEVEALVLLHKKGFVIKEVAVEMNERTGGVSSITPIRSAYYMVKVLLAIFIDLIKKV